MALTGIPINQTTNTPNFWQKSTTSSTTGSRNSPTAYLINGSGRGLLRWISTYGAVAGCQGGSPAGGGQRTTSTAHANHPGSPAHVHPPHPDQNRLPVSPLPAPSCSASLCCCSPHPHQNCLPLLRLCCACCQNAADSASTRTMEEHAGVTHA
jgi:hypothetical protein